MTEFSQWLNYGILDGILNGIASVALLPRNDGDSRNDGDFRWNFHNDGDLMGLLRLF